MADNRNKLIYIKLDGENGKNVIVPTSDIYLTLGQKLQKGEKVNVLYNKVFVKGVLLGKVSGSSFSGRESLAESLVSVSVPEHTGSVPDTALQSLENLLNDNNSEDIQSLDLGERSQQVAEVNNNSNDPHSDNQPGEGNDAEEVEEEEEDIMNEGDQQMQTQQLYRANQKFRNNITTVELIDNFFVRGDILDDAKIEARSVTDLASRLLPGVYKHSALMEGTFSGRSYITLPSGRRQYKKVTKLHPGAKKAIIKFVTQEAIKTQWLRPKDLEKGTVRRSYRNNVTRAMTDYVSTYKKVHRLQKQQQEEANRERQEAETDAGGDQENV